MALGRMPAALRLDLRPASEALPGLGIVQDRGFSVDSVLGVGVPVLGGLPMLLQPGPDPGVTIHCRVHTGHASRQEIPYRKAQRTGDTGAVPHDPTIYLGSAVGAFWDWPGDTEVVLARKPA